MSKLPSIHTFPQPVTVLRYLPQEICWPKAEYRALASRLPVWDQTATLTNGYIRQGQLMLRADLLQHTEGKPSDILLLQGAQSAQWIRLAPSHRVPFFLNLHRKAEAIWVELYDNYYPNFGSKRRDYFDLFPLPPGKSAAVHINVRYWHTMAGRSMNTYYGEHYLYLENLGVFDQAVLVEGLAEAFVFRPEKEVDLREMMY